jgi:hypothetical protein
MNISRGAEETEKLFAAIKSGKYEAYTSSTVIKELMDAPKAKRDVRDELVEQYVKEVLKPDADQEKA